jgi:hypothetical protein
MMFQNQTTIVVYQGLNRLKLINFQNTIKRGNIHIE